jgi:carboxylesterase type B
MPLECKALFKDGKLLLMGSSAFQAGMLPAEVRKAIDEAIQHGMTIIVGETYGAGRLFQDYLQSKGYRDVIVGHAKRLRYNAGNWTAVQYGKDLEERERRMIEACDSAVVIWMNGSGVIAENLELLKRLGKPTFLYECSTSTGAVKAGPLDPSRTYDLFYWMKEHERKRRATNQEH